jgi:hypothetical protein
MSSSLNNTISLHHGPDGRVGPVFVSPKNLGAHDETLKVQSNEAYHPSVDAVARIKKRGF